jgi:hypothetical protein
MILPSVNRFRAEMGGQFRIMTESSMRSSTTEDRVKLGDRVDFYV